MDKRTLTPGELGHGFEEEVRNIFERNGYLLLRKNYWKKNYALENDRAVRREYDLVMLNYHELQVYIIECKAHYSESKYVNEELVSEFTHKLRHYNGKYARRMMVTDTDFTDEAKMIAHRNRIMLVNGRELRKMSNNVLGRIEGRIVKKVRSGLEGIIMRSLRNYLL